MLTRRRVSFAVIVIIAIAGAAIGTRALARSRTYQLFGTLVAHAPTTQRRVALTFDDGPVTAHIDQLLTTLAARGVDATFFVTGRELLHSPDAGRRLVAAGHELGNHTFTHARMALASPRGFVWSSSPRIRSFAPRATRAQSIFVRVRLQARDAGPVRELVR